MVTGITLRCALSCRHLGAEYKLSSVEKHGLFWSEAQVTAHINQSLSAMTNLTLTISYTPLRPYPRTWQSSRMSLQKFWKFYNSILSLLIHFTWRTQNSLLPRRSIPRRPALWPGRKSRSPTKQPGDLDPSPRTRWASFYICRIRVSARWILNSFPETDCSDTLSRTKIRYLCSKSSKSALWIPGRVKPKAFV